MRIEPAELSFDATGVPFSARYGDVYASRDGALGQARHVFLQGAACIERWRHRAQFVVLETGFGLGINFLATWQAWSDDPARPQRLHFVSLERHPLPAAAIEAAASAELKPLAAQLAQQWPAAVGGLHRCEFDDGRVCLTIALGDARDLAPRLRLGADAIFLDGFAPDRNPEMWELPLLKALARCARADCRIATWTTARTVRDALADAGFHVEVVPGFGHKRSMLTGRFAPRHAVRRRAPPTAWQGDRSALVVGAGLAGAACANALARRDWRVTVVDIGAPASAASALPWGLMHPHFAIDNNRLARLTRSAAALAQRTLHRIAPGGRRDGHAVWSGDGVFQQAASDDVARRWAAAIEAIGLPRDVAEWLDAAAAARHTGVVPARAGLWWPQGRIVSPTRWVDGLLADARAVVLRGTVGGVERRADSWCALAPDGRELARAPVAIVAAALATPGLIGSKLLPMQAIAGRVTRIESDALGSLRAGLAGDGTLLRAPDGMMLAGATYETFERGIELDESIATQSNMARLQRLLATRCDARGTGSFGGVRCAARDRLPYAGPVADETAASAAVDAMRGAHFDDLPRREGLFVATAFGARGLTLTVLAAELIAARIEGEPWPVERELADALDPARFLLRRLRRSDAMMRSDLATV